MESEFTIRENLRKKFLIKQGDILLFGGSDGIMSKLIRFFDDAEYTHVGIAINVGAKLCVLDMWLRGIEIVPIGVRTAIYPNIAVIRLSEDTIKISDTLYNILLEWDISGKIKYDYWLLPRIAIAKKLGIDFLAWGSGDRRICSELVQEYANEFTDAYKDITLITPQDFLRYKKDDCRAFKRDYYGYFEEII